MKKSGMKNLLKLSFSEELFNCITHGISAIVILILIPICAIYSYKIGGSIRALGVSVFLISLFLMFLVSTLYHAMDFNSSQKFIFRILDHIFIYVAIAGSYTPIALCLIQGIEGIIILVIQWLMVLIGVLYKSLSEKSLPKLSLTIYLIMGWIVVLFFPALLKHASISFLALLIGGGVLYSIGAYFYSRKWKFAHSIWHIFITLASILHILAIVIFM